MKIKNLEIKNKNELFKEKEKTIAEMQGNLDHLDIISVQKILSPHFTESQIRIIIQIHFHPPEKDKEGNIKDCRINWTTEDVSMAMSLRSKSTHAYERQKIFWNWSSISVYLATLVVETLLDSRSFT